MPIKKTGFEKRQEKRVARASTAATIASIKAPKKDARASRVASVVSSKGPKRLSTSNSSNSTNNINNNTSSNSNSNRNTNNNSMVAKPSMKSSRDIPLPMTRPNDIKIGIGIKPPKKIEKKPPLKSNIPTTRKGKLPNGGLGFGGGGAGGSW